VFSRVVGATLASADPVRLAALARLCERYLAEPELASIALAALVQLLGGPGGADGDSTEATHASMWLALVLRARGMFDEAIQVYEQAIKLQIRAVGPDHPTIGSTLGNIAAVLVKKNRLGEALGRLQEALRICTKAYGGSHRLTVMTARMCTRVAKLVSRQQPR
jgi:tetratricopeptide (TPR) repeat protein